MRLRALPTSRPVLTVTYVRPTKLLIGQTEDGRPKRTLLKKEEPLGEQWLLAVIAEEDGEHYEGRAEPPGPMHQVTEAFIRRTGNQDRN